MRGKRLLRCVLLTTLAGVAGLLAAACTSPANHGTRGTPASPRPVLSASDGTAVGVCATRGSCQVQVSAGVTVPVPAGWHVTSVRVTSVTDDQVSIHGQLTGDTTITSCTGTGACDSSSDSTGLRVRLGIGSTAVANGMSLTVLAVHARTAILDIRPA